MACRGTALLFTFFSFSFIISFFQILRSVWHCPHSETVLVFCARTFSKSEDNKGFVNAEGELGSPESLPEPERPPLRHIDKYVRPECPCLSKRYTMAVLTCVGTTCCSRYNRAVTNNDQGHGQADLAYLIVPSSSVTWNEIVLCR
jgi:hypothetical protein